MQFSTVALISFAAVAAAQSSVAVVSQITDGQIQATTSTETPTSSSVAVSTVAVVSQITDGQIQASNSTTASNATTIATASNGAAKYGAGAFAGLAAGAAALLL